MNAQPAGQQADEACDVLIVGGGPAGSTAASFLRRKGWSVLLLEKAQHPRFHIGESLLPMNLPIFDRLGVMDKVEAMGVPKLAADFECNSETGYHRFAFDRALGKSPGYAFQVCRADFDAMLFRHAREQGADARQGHKVVSVEHRDARESVATVESETGRSYQVRARYVLDASGRDALLSQHKKLMRRNTRHQSAAVFGHFRGALFREGQDRGNISIYRFEHGWMWMIPQPDGSMSVGAVCRPAYLRQRRGDMREFLMQTIRLNPALHARMENAQLIDDTVRVAGNYTYDSRQMAGPGWMLIGDAFAFLDPVFSSGVFLAMSGAEQAAEIVDAALRDPACEAALQERMEKKVRTGMRRFAWFIYRFNSPGMRRLFDQPSNVLDIERGVISMLAGDVFGNGPVLRRLILFKLIYAALVLINPDSWRWNRRSIAIPMDDGAVPRR
ncbi:MAG: NAD(P)/FAD-dependent oxidoreductase [Rhodanobacteraceae bacterium]